MPLASTRHRRTSTRCRSFATKRSSFVAPGSSTLWASIQVVARSNNALGRSRLLRDVLTIMERVQESKAGFRSLTEAVDTTTPAGRMMMQMVGAFAEFERAMLKERTKAGLDAARKEGRIGGSRPKLSPQHQAGIKKM